MSNHYASFGPSGTAFAAPNRYGGRVQTSPSGELALPLNNGTWFTVDGSAPIKRLPSTNVRTPINLYCSGTPTFTYSTNLLTPGNKDFPVKAGDTIALLPLGDGIWRLLGSLSADGTVQDVLIGSSSGASNVVAVGDSITFGSGGSAPFSSYITLSTYNGQSVTLSNIGVSGRTIQDMAKLASTNLLPLFSSQSGMNVALVLGGTNDLFQGASVAQTFSYIEQFCQHLRNLGWKVVVGTLPSATSIDANVQILNGYLRAQWTRFADDLADYAGNANIGGVGAYANSTYFNVDGIHPKDAGYTQMGAIAQTAVNRVITGATQWTSLNFHALGTVGTTPGIIVENTDLTGFAEFEMRGSTHSYYIGVGNTSAPTAGQLFIFDNTNTKFRMVMDTDGSTRWLAAMTVAAGGGTDYGKVGGTLSAPASAVGTPANTSETDLQTYSLPANTLNANGRGVRVTAGGSFAANGNTKNIRMYFGAQMTGMGASVQNGTKWKGEAIVLRRGSNSQTFSAGIQAGSTPSPLDGGTLSQTDTSAITIKVTGINGSASANDIVCDWMLVEML